MTDRLPDPSARPRPPDATGAVVVGVDDGPPPGGLLEHAVRVALRRGCAVRVVHFHGPESPPASGNDDAGARAQAHLLRAAPISVVRRCPDGDRADALAAAADPEGVIVLAHRHRRLGSAAGTTLDAVIEVAPCPVLVVDESAAPPTADGGVVVGVDGSPDAATVLRCALGAADDLATRTRAISTWTVLDDEPAADLDALLHTVGADFPTVPLTLKRVEDRAGRRLLLAGENAALLVLGHRHAAAAGLRGRGSTARTVLAAPTCPVLVVGPRVLDAAIGTDGPPAAGHPSALG